jgi:soluble lytic murein transglycosylase-like protein
MKAASLIAAGLLASAALHVVTLGAAKAEGPGGVASTPAPAPPSSATPEGAGQPRPAAASAPARETPDAAPEPAAGANGAASAAPATSARSDIVDKTADSDSLCALMKSVAGERGLPFDFFARLIWRESRFRADSVGPRTRTGQRALGIAQFMPGTAAERGISDPFDPARALQESAAFLGELRTAFGNLGLAAAAYNAGPGRVRHWINGTGSLPPETRRYVRAITGRSAEEWVAVGRAGSATPSGTAPGCDDLLAALRTRPPIRSAAPDPSAPAAPPNAPAAALPWGVQLCAGFSRDHVLTSFARLSKQLHAALPGTGAELIRSRQRSRGTHEFYQVRVGAETRAEADRICARVRSAGGACLVMRNKTSTVEPI